MTITTADRAWFTANPGRDYLCRPVPREEAARWLRPPTADRFPWCVIRRSDEGIRYFTLPAHTALDDTDAELGPIFGQLRERRATAPETFPPSPGGTLARIEGSLSALLAASTPFEPNARPAVAYRDAMRDRGREALAIGGHETLDYLARRLAETDPDRAEVHAAILQVAWDGLAEARR